MGAYIIRVIAKTLLRAEWAALHSEVIRRHSMLTDGSNPVAPLLVQRLLVSGEDHRHGRHCGFDLYAICRAIWRRVAWSRREGASTIEQQIVRVLTNRFEPTVSRKVRELLLAALLSKAIPKSATPSLYLSIGYFGWRMNSFAQACRKLGIRPDTISLEEAAGLVARLKYPEPHVSPVSRLAQINRRCEHLKHLYRRHLADGTYSHLGAREINEATSSGSPITEAVLPIS
jgi:membrane carboxypeptidase/penicillin-binding protein